MLGCVSGETAKLIRYFQNNPQNETITDSIFIYSEIYQQLGKLDWKLVLQSANNPTYFEKYDMISAPPYIACPPPSTRPVYLTQSFPKLASFAKIMLISSLTSIQLFNKVMEFRFQIEQTELIVK